MQHIRPQWLPGIGTLLLVLGVVGVSAEAAPPTFEPLASAQAVNDLLALDGHVFAGTTDGGVWVWDGEDPSSRRRWTAGPRLSSSRVTDLTWTGRNLWIASDDGGLTQVTDPVSSAPSFTQFGTRLPTTDVTCVAGTVVDDAERVWYGLAAGGLGEIISGFPGAVYTATEDGIIGNDVQTLQVHGGALWIGTPVGVARFEDGVFHDEVAGLTGLDVRDFASDGAGNLHAGGTGGVFRWDAGASTWIELGGIGRTVAKVAFVGTELYALGVYSGGTASLHRYVGTAFDAIALTESITLALAGGDDLWLGGRFIETGMHNSRSSLPYLGRLEAGDAITTWRPEVPIVANAAGVAFGPDGRAWMGSRWGESFDVQAADGTWDHHFELASAENDSSGLLAHWAPILAMAGGVGGEIWLAELGAGVVRHDPVTGRNDGLRSADSGLTGNSIVNITVHPDGPVIFMHDWSDEPEKVNVLVDPDHWRNPALWLNLPTGVGGLGTGPTVWDAYVERRDIVWFAVEGTGLVRWDINGSSAGPDDPITWLDQSDDFWSAPVTEFPGSGVTQDPAQVRGLATGPDGTIWAGGNGLVRFRWDSGFIDVFENLFAFDGTGTGLSNSRVWDVVADRHGYLWAVTSSGLDRVRLTAGDPIVDSWFDAVTFAADTGVNSRYSPTRVAELPGANYDFTRLAVDPSGEHILVSADRGVALVDVGDAVVAGSSTEEAGHLYPNPWRPGMGDGPLKLGGLPTATGETVAVEIYTLEGQLVYEDPAVLSDQEFWTGANRVGVPVASGMYVVRVVWREGVLTRTLAVVR